MPTIAIHTNDRGEPWTPLDWARMVIASIDDDDDRAPSYPVPPELLPHALRKRRERPERESTGPPSVREVLERELAIDPDEPGA
jgi:hypothetical protein